MGFALFSGKIWFFHFFFPFSLLLRLGVYQSHDSVLLRLNPGRQTFSDSHVFFAPHEQTLNSCRGEWPRLGASRSTAAGCTSSRTCSANGRSRLSLLSLLFSPLASLFSLSFLPPLLSLCLSLSLSLFSHLSLQEGSCGVVLPPFFTTRFRPVHFPHPSYPLRRPPSPSLMVPLHSASSARPRRRRERRRQRPPTPQAPRGT